MDHLWASPSILARIFLSHEILISQTKIQTRQFVPNYLTDWVIVKTITDQITFITARL